MKHFLSIAFFAAAVAAPLGAHAQSIFDEVRGGLLLQSVGPFSSDKESGVGINGELLFKPLEGLSFIGAPRPHIGFSIATDSDATSQGYFGLTWEQHLGRKFFVNAGFGGAIHNGETDFDPLDPNINTTKYLGCRALFRLSGGVGYMLTDRVSASVHLDHISNAGLCDENEGLDNTGLRLGYKF